jgi:lanthionine synthetase-like protein
VLYIPEAFEALVDDRWDEARVRAAIGTIVADVDEVFDRVTLWPAAEADADGAPAPLKDLYCGAAGVVWALDALRRRGQAETRIDLAVVAGRVLELQRERPDYLAWGAVPMPAESSLFCGETGLLLLSWRLAPSAELADLLLERVRTNLANEAEELMWGSPGTLVAAHVMHGWTGEDRWLEAWRESAEALRSRRDPNGLWTQRLYGADPRQIVGPAHGLVGIVFALLQGEDDEQLARETAAVLASEAVVEDGLANWPAVAGGPLERNDQIRVQWCHGAAGVVSTAAAYLDEELLLAGAELVWRAGAHGPEKGAGLCHGTAGNGYALLAAFEHTGDERWLERARRFAVHALAQAAGERSEAGRGRYSLLTGDLGVALYAASCLDGDARFPVLDGWD